jgi:hypothetical protein
MDSTNTKFWLNLLLIQCIRLGKECLKHADSLLCTTENKNHNPVVHGTQNVYAKE